MIIRQFDPTADAPTISVLIGLVSTEDDKRVIEALESLAERQGMYDCQVVIADRRNDATSCEIARRFPQVMLIACPAGTGLPAMRTIAFDRSSGDIVAVMEDHCVPASGWLQQVAEALAPGSPATVAVGGCVENGVCDSALDWATFICEYSFFSPPVADGETTLLPGMNIAYRRAALGAVPRELLTSGFWETTAHPLLLRNGGRFVSRNAMKMYHCKKFSLRLFTSQRFLYSRYFGGIRFPRRQWARRLIAAATTTLLPAILLKRMVVQSTGAKRLGREMFMALPILAWFAVVWSIGEMAGYLFGPGDALERIE